VDARNNMIERIKKENKRIERLSPVVVQVLPFQGEHPSG
jgi:hypothetical protein